MGHVVVAEDAFGAVEPLDPLDPRGVVQRVGIDDQAGKQLAQRRKRRVIGDIGAGKDQRRLFPVQVGQFGFQPLVIDRGARDVARAPRACAGGVQRLVHGGQDDGVLAHAQIVVAAPDRDLAFRPVGSRPDGLGIGTLAALDIDERPIPAFLVQFADGLIEGG